MPPHAQPSPGLYGSLVLPAVLLFVTFALRYWRSKSGKIPFLKILTIAVFVMLFLDGSIWLFIGRSIPAADFRFFNCPVSDIQSVRMQPFGINPLVDHELVITNASSIAEIMTSIRSASDYFPNHHGEEWECVLVISDAKGASRLAVGNALDQGAIIYCEVTGGFIYKTLTSETLGTVLERATKEERSSHLPAAAGRIFERQISTVRSLLILPLGSASLVGRDVTVTNTAIIDRIMAAIRSAKACAYNPPADEWSCVLFVPGPTRPSYIDVFVTSNQDAILYLPGGPYQSDTLAEILESVTGRQTNAIP